MSESLSGRRPTVTRIAAVRPGRRVTVAGVIRSTAAELIGTSPAFRCVIADGGGEIDVIFLGRWQVAGLAAGRRCGLHGRACAYRERLVIWNPRYWLEPLGPAGAAAAPRPGCDREAVRQC